MTGLIESFKFVEIILETYAREQLLWMMESVE